MHTGFWLLQSPPSVHPAQGPQTSAVLGSPSVLQKGLSCLLPGASEVTWEEGSVPSDSAAPGTSDYFPESSPPHLLTDLV